MKTVIIEQTDEWQIESHDNGAAYTLYRKQDMAECFVQYGDDASAWREEYDAMRKAYQDMSSAWYKQNWNACLAYLWDLS